MGSIPMKTLTIGENVFEIVDEQARNNIETLNNTLENMVVEETDPTVPVWAKEATKPTYTAAEVGARPNTWTPSASDVGALPDTTKIPTKTSDLTNDSGFLTQHQSLADYAKKSELPTDLADLTGDSTHRTVTDAEKNTWNAKSDFSGSYNDLTNKPTIPSLDGYATESYVTGYAQPKGNYLTEVPSEYVTETELDAKNYLTEHQDLSAYAKTADIPTNVSELTNDSGYLTSIPSEYVTETELTAKGYALQTALDTLAEEVANQEEVITQNVLDALDFDVFGKVDSENNVIIEQTLSSGAYAFKYENGDGTYTDIGTLNIGSVSHTITQNLTSITSDNSATSIEDGESLTINLTASSGYEITSVTVKMGGVDITSTAYSNGTVTIASVSGDVVITAVAEIPAPAYTNLYDADKVLLNARVNSSRTAVTGNGNFITHWIALPDNFASEECFLYLKGINPTGGSTISYSKLLFREDSTVDGTSLVVGDTTNTALQFSLTTNLGVKWETLDAGSLYYKIDLRRNAEGTIVSHVNHSKCFALALNISTSALTKDSLPDIIMTLNEEIV